MIVIHNIDLDQLMQILSGIRVDTNIVDMEVDDVEKTIVFIPVKKEGEENSEDKSDMLDITERIKKMKEEFDKAQENPDSKKESPKTNFKDLNKLI
jgi:hypothetical protein